MTEFARPSQQEQFSTRDAELPKSLRDSSSERPASEYNLLDLEGFFDALRAHDFALNT